MIVKRWAGLLLVLVVSAVVAFAITARTRPVDCVALHARIRPGMTVHEIGDIMHPVVIQVHAQHLLWAAVSRFLPLNKADRPMRRWLGLFAVLAIAAIAVVVVTNSRRPEPLDARHARVRPGMTEDRVTSIMAGRGPNFRPAVLYGHDGIQAGDAHYFEWRMQDDSVRPWHDVGRRVYFDADGLVTRTTVGEGRPR